MAKINNVIRIVEFENEHELYSALDKDLVSYFNEPDSRCYKLKNIQLMDSNHAILYFEEDLDIIMVRFIQNGEVISVEDAPEQINYFSLQELSLMDNLGVVTIGDTAYDIEEVEYVIDMYGVRHADVFLN